MVAAFWWCEALEFLDPENIGALELAYRIIRQESSFLSMGCLPTYRLGSLESFHHNYNLPPSRVNCLLQLVLSLAYETAFFSKQTLDQSDL
jgi:hypothetical protein